MNFLVQCVGNNTTTPNWWTFYVDSASNVKGSRARIILEGLDNVTLEQALKPNFRALNNQAEYKALIACLKLDREVGAKRLRFYPNSQLVHKQVANTYQTKETVLLKYYHIVMRT